MIQIYNVVIQESSQSHPGLSPLNQRVMRKLSQIFIEMSQSHPGLSPLNLSSARDPRDGYRESQSHPGLSPLNLAC